MVPNSITVDFPADYTTSGANKVSTIKAIRTLTGLSLKEAKDLSEQVGPQRVMISVYPTEDYVTGRPVTAQENFDRGLQELRRQGLQVTINAARVRLIDDVRRLASEAVLRDENDLAVALIDVLKRFG